MSLPLSAPGRPLLHLRFKTTRKCADTPDMPVRRPSPRQALTVGLVGAVIAGAVAMVTTTLNNRPTILDAGRSFLHSEPIRQAFAGQISESIAPPSASTSEELLTAANDTAGRVVSTAEFDAALDQALPAIYAQLVHGAPGDTVLDPALISQAFATAGSTPPPTLVLSARRDTVPDLHDPIDRMGTIALGLGALSVLLIGYGITGAPYRGRTLMRIGRWLIAFSLVTVAIVWALPTMALVPFGGWVGLVGITLRSGTWLTAPAVAAGLVGLTIIMIGRARDASTRVHHLAVIPHAAGRTPQRPRTT